jgi:peptidoglycan/LPS O-acetylase OafA/YrhL
MWGHWAEVRFQSPIAGAYASLGRRIFFVLSGFLITMLLTRELEKTSTIRLKRFYVRRAYRILPGAMLFMAVVFGIFWHDLRWYHMAAVVLYLVNYDFAHPWFIGHLWSLSVQEQFYFVWPVVLKRWYRQRVWILVAALGCAPMFRVVCHFLRLHGRGDEAFPAVADILAIGCLLAIFSKGLPKIRAGWAALMIIPVLLVPVYMGVLRFHTTVVLLLVLWPVMHFSISGLLLHVVQRPYRILNFGPVVWLGKMSYGLYLWQQLFAFGDRPRPWYFPLFAVVVAAGSYYLLEQPMIRMRERERRAEERDGVGSGRVRAVCRVAQYPAGG